MLKKFAVERPPFGRRRGFDADIALRVAVDLFWQQGYEATSLISLIQAMEISRSSFYACFGSKHALFIAAVQRYADDRFAALNERASSSDDPRDSVCAMLAVIADVDSGTRGCLFVNVVAELAPGDAELVALARSHTTRVGALMTATLRRCGCAEGEASERASALLALVMGITMLRKTGVPLSQLTGLLTQAVHLIPSTSPSPPPPLRKHP